MIKRVNKRHKNKRRKTGMALLVAMIVLVAAAFGGAAQAAGNETVTLWIYKVWEGGERAVVLCRYLDRETGENLRERDVLIKSAGESYIFRIPLIDGYDYSGTDPRGEPAEGITRPGGNVVTMYYERQQPPPAQRILYRVTYEKNDGSGETTAYDPVPAGTTHHIPQEQIGLPRKSYIHIGWSESPDGEGRLYENYDEYMREQNHTITVDRDIILYAIWSPLE